MSRRVTRPGLSAAQVQALLTAGGYATTTDVSTAIANLVNTAPEALDTLNELAAALDNDPDFAENVLEAIGTKADKATAFVVVAHGSDGSTARPTGVGAVYWVGSVEPTNATNADWWYDTTGDS